MMDFVLQQGDILIANGDFTLCDDEVHAIGQALSICLKTFAGEWFLDGNVGLPYLTHVLGKKNNEKFLRRLVLETVKSLPGVIDVREFLIEQGEAERSVSIKFNAILSDQSMIRIDETIGA